MECFDDALLEYLESGTRDFKVNDMELSFYQYKEKHYVRCEKVPTSLFAMFVEERNAYLIVWNDVYHQLYYNAYLDHRLEKVYSDMEDKYERLKTYVTLNICTT